MAQDTGCDFWITKLRDFLANHCYSRQAIKNYGMVAKRFLRYIESRGVSIESAQADCVAGYLRLELNRYRRKHARGPGTMGDWRWHLLTPIHKLLALAQGVWPPISPVDARVEWFMGELKAAKHSPCTVSTYARVETFSPICTAKTSISKMFSPRMFQHSSTMNCGDTGSGTVACLDESWIAGAA